jgi:YVTN family beta-propeller protein
MGFVSVYLCPMNLRWIGMMTGWLGAVWQAAGQCPPGNIQDCNGNCYPASWVGDGVCDDGIQYASNFMCAQFNWDGGDCDNCPPGFVADCNGNCQPASWVGDGVCDDGIQYASDFMCAQFNWDGGDCDNCPPGFVADCNGTCYPASWIGDGICHDGSGADFNCQVFDFDGGDCPFQGCTDVDATNYNPSAEQDDGTCYYTPCPPGQFADCTGSCRQDAWLQYLGNWHCNRGLWLSSPTYFDLGPLALDFNCELFNFDNGDCLTPGCTEPAAENYYEHADTDDGSCFYGSCTTGISDCMGRCVPEGWIGQNECNGPSESPIDHLFGGAYPDKLLANIPVGSSPRGMCVLPDGSKAYVGCSGQISVVDLTQPLGCASVSAINNGGGLSYTCSASADGSKVFVSNSTINQVQVIDTNTDQIIAGIPVGSLPLKMWTSHSGEHVFVSCNFAHQVYMIKVATLTVEHVFHTGLQPRNICTSPDDTRLYTADWMSATMSVFSTLPPYQLIATVPVDYWPQAIYATPDDKYVLVANFGFDFSYDHCSVIRTSDWQVIARLRTGAGPEDMVSIGPNGEYLYVTNWGRPCCFYTAYDLCCSASLNHGTMSIIAMPDFDAIVAPGTLPDPIPYLDFTIATFSLNAEYSFGMATHPSGQYVYAVNMNTNNMSVIGFEQSSITQQGESCEDAIPLATLSDCVENDTSCFYDHHNEACPFGVTGASDLVYSYTPSVTLHGSMEMCTSSFDTKLYIYEDSCGPYSGGTALYCNDDACGQNGWRSSLQNVTLAAGHTYYIVVDGYGPADRGAFQLCFDLWCFSDFNQDGLVGYADLVLLMAGFGIQYDMNALIWFLADYGQVCGM